MFHRSGSSFISKIKPSGLLLNFNNANIGYFLLFCSLLLGMVTLKWGIFLDEADNLVVGSFIAKGSLLYKDLFSHHFPLPYFWAAIIISIFGKSLFFIRSSILLFQLLVFGISMKISKLFIQIGLVSLSWSLIRILYKGNLLLYSTLSALAVFGIFIITFTIISKSGNKNSNIAIFSIFSFIAFLSDPLTIYPIAISILFIFVNSMEIGIKTISVLAMFSIILIFSFFLLGILEPFIEYAFYFNINIYAKYSYTNPIRLLDFVKNALSGLSIFQKHWWNLNFFQLFSEDYRQLDSWFFTGGLYRLSVLTTTIILLIKKNYKLGFYIYTFSCATLVIKQWEFRSQSFVIFSIFLLFLGFSEISKFKDESSHQTFRIFLRVTNLILITSLIWLIFRVSIHLKDNFNQQNYRIQLASTVEKVRILENVSCNYENVKLGYYPSGLYTYWLSDFKPVSEQLFLWPWNAEIGLFDLLEDLNQKNINAIIVLENTVIWGLFDTKDYLKPLDDFLTQNYIVVQDNIYLSPSLYEACYP